MIKGILTIGLLLAVGNASVKYLLLPYVQDSANHHNGEADLVSIAFTLTSIIAIIKGTRGLYLKKNMTLNCLLLVIGINLLLWIPILMVIQCKECSRA